MPSRAQGVPEPCGSGHGRGIACLPTSSPGCGSAARPPQRGVLQSAGSSRKGPASMPSVGIVTGAASGMGFTTARRIADMVDVLLLVDRDEGALAGAAQNLSLGDQRAVLEPFV